MKSSSKVSLKICASWPPIGTRATPTTQNRALSALLFLYRHVLHQDLPWLDDVVRARRPKHLPVVLTREEVRAVISELDGTCLRECARLRVQDIDFGMNQIVVRDGKGAKDRVTVLPAVAKELLARHLRRVKRQHEAVLAVGFPATRFYVDRLTGLRRRHHLYEREASCLATR